MPVPIATNRPTSDLSRKLVIGHNAIESPLFVNNDLTEAIYCNIVVMFLVYLYDRIYLYESIGSVYMPVELSISMFAWHRFGIAPQRAKFPALERGYLRVRQCIFLQEFFGVAVKRESLGRS